MITESLQQNLNKKGEENMLKSMAPILKITRNLALIGCILSLILSTHCTIKKEKEGTNKFIMISIAFATISAISIMALKA